MSKAKTIVPIFYSTDDNYVPWLCASLASLVEHTSRKNHYIIHILNNGLSKESMDNLSLYSKENVEIQFVNLSEKIKPFEESLKEVYYFKMQVYFRLFIASMFPQYDKVLYLDCDTIILSDIASLFNINLDGNILGATMDQIIAVTDLLKEYALKAVGVHYKQYFNSGVLVIDAKKFRDEHIEKQFIHLITTYNFDVIAPDQDYLNYLCRGRVKYFDKNWNKMPLNDGWSGKINLIHYNFFRKPWRDNCIKYRKYFWEYCKKTPYYDYALEYSVSITPQDKIKAKKGTVAIVLHSQDVVKNGNNFHTILDNQGVAGSNAEAQDETADCPIQGFGIEKSVSLV